jgi:DNA-binding HxlR family transcriptional regulator
MKVRDTASCFPVQVTLRVIGGKWKPLILWHLKNQTLRFSELHKQIEGITQKMLTQQLREMEHDGLILRKVYPQVPPKVEYAVSVYGKTLQPLLTIMEEWGIKHKNRLS